MTPGLPGWHGSNLVGQYHVGSFGVRKFARRGLASLKLSRSGGNRFSHPADAGDE
jgi:hypothetical protein